VRIWAAKGVNLNHVKPDVLEAVVKYGVRQLRVSLDGASQETYSVYRVRGNFERVIENVRTINAFKAQYGTEYPELLWQFIVFGHNEHELPQARALAAELNMKFKPKLTVNTRIGTDGQPYFDPNGKPDTRDSGRFNWWGRDVEWKDVLGIRGKRDVEKPTGEWNTMVVICQGDTLTYLVNGVLVNQGRGANQTRGKLQFQSEGAEILFRKIEIRPLIKP